MSGMSESGTWQLIAASATPVQFGDSLPANVLYSVTNKELFCLEIKDIIYVQETRDLTVMNAQ